MTPAARTAPGSAGGADWRDVPLAPVVLFFGPEGNCVPITPSLK